MKKNFKNSKLTALRRSKRSDHQQGFNLVELIISLAVGLVLFAGVMSVFVGMRTTTAETSSYGELQENASFALSVLTNDLLRQNFWGDYTGTISFSSLSAVPAAAPSPECLGGGSNNGTYPLAPNLGGYFRTLWGETSTTGGNTVMSCIDDGMAAPNSDVLQLKRVITMPSAATPVNFSYFVGNTDDGAIYQNPGGVAPVIVNSRVWQYQHHVYYVQQQNAAAIPVLMQGRLTTNMTMSPIIDGIEKIYFMYGISTVTNATLPGFGVVNAYLSAASMTAAALWDNNTSSIISVKIYVLARSILPDMNYTNENTYTMGDQAAYTPADNFRRLLLSSTVTLYNSETNLWVRNPTIVALPPAAP